MSNNVFSQGGISIHVILKIASAVKKPPLEVFGLAEQCCFHHSGIARVLITQAIRTTTTLPRKAHWREALRAMMPSEERPYGCSADVMTWVTDLAISVRLCKPDVA